MPTTIDEGVSYTVVESSNVFSVGYRVSDKTLFVKFKSEKRGYEGSRYTYYDVPSDVYLALLNAPSKGKYLAANVKGKYSFAQF
ncbi:MAG: KTSC domain-containing protein [Planctomycetaceae bacterium]|nr:KTSC domain-containing protein [Planctomycetaceae bacterium]